MATETANFVSTHVPTLNPSQPVVSCVVCINASRKARLSWKPHGVQYTPSYMRALQLPHPTAAIRLLSVLFTSLPQSVPISHFVTRPYPFLELTHFRSTLPGLLPLTLRPHLSPTLDPSADYGGDKPAILNAVICALDFLDRIHSSAGGPSCHPIDRHVHQPTSLSLVTSLAYLHARAPSEVSATSWPFTTS
jgi:hypothetical protein